ncbi:MAG TPA: hypothetical protein VFM68_04500 [Candidatus Saccharimonadales bacterium]|nr:hypothetical protein [Candidatus Saccharimonadales bacterium]
MIDEANRIDIKVSKEVTDTLSALADQYSIDTMQVIHRAVRLAALIADDLAASEQTAGRRLESCDQHGRRRRQLTVGYDQSPANGRLAWLHVDVDVSVEELLHQLMRQYNTTLDQVVIESVNLYKDISDEVDSNRVVRLCDRDGTNGKSLTRLVP